MPSDLLLEPLLETAEVESGRNYQYLSPFGQEAL